MIFPEKRKRLDVRCRFVPYTVNVPFGTTLAQQVTSLRLGGGIERDMVTGD